MCRRPAPDTRGVNYTTYLFLTMLVKQFGVPARGTSDAPAKPKGMPTAVFIGCTLPVNYFTPEG